MTNYATDKPSFAHSCETTEFDDALLQRGIVNRTQVMLAKGASLEEANRLVVLSKEQQQGHLQDSGGVKEQESVKQQQQQTAAAADDDEDDDDESFLDDDDNDYFLERYRQERMAQLRLDQQDKRQRFGDIFLIDRTEWTKHVNEASEQAWVVVCLTSSDQERTGSMERAVTELAPQQHTVKFVLIPAHQAIENWPQDNLPTLFLYRHGKLQKQLVKLPCDMSSEELCEVLKPIWTNR